MFDKIKSVVQMDDKVNGINAQLIETTKKIVELDSSVKNLTEKLSEIQKIKDEQTRYLADFKDNLQFISDFKNELKKEMYDFKMIKSQVQNDLMKKFEEELDKELKINLERLKEDDELLTQVKAKLDSNLANFDILNKEMIKLTEISKNIKKEDFELSKFSNDLLRMDREKLELMRKIDTLERLVSSLRRRPNEVRGFGRR